ncbi:MAG: LapA family protein [Planctomycetota bacterium]
MLQKIRWFLLLLGILIVVMVCLQNRDPVSLQLLFFEGEYPLTLMLLATSAASFVFGSLMTMWVMRAKKPAKHPPAKTKATPAASEPVTKKAPSAEAP